MSRVLAVTIAPVLLVVAAPLAAQAPAPASGQAQAAPQKSAPGDEIICEKQAVIGSRLAKKKVCMTRAQWADMRLQDRQEVERVQVQRGAKGE